MIWQVWYFYCLNRNRFNQTEEWHEHRFRFFSIRFFFRLAEWSETKNGIFQEFLCLHCEKSQFVDISSDFSRSTANGIFEKCINSSELVSLRSKQFTFHDADKLLSELAIIVSDNSQNYRIGNGILSSFIALLGEKAVYYRDKGLPIDRFYS